MAWVLPLYSMDMGVCGAPASFPACSGPCWRGSVTWQVCSAPAPSPACSGRCRRGSEATPHPDPPLALPAEHTFML